MESPTDTPKTTVQRQSRPRVAHLVSAGGVVFRRRGASTEVVLCGRTNPAQWRLPKGTPEPGETLEETARREVREETGLEVRIIAPLGQIEYWFHNEGVRCHKRVHHYLMTPVGGATELHDPEFDLVDWFPIDEASSIMTYRNEADVLERARQAVPPHPAGGSADGDPH